MKVMMLMMSNPQSEAGQKPPTEEALIAMHNFNEELEKAGVLVDLGGLTPTSRGARLKYKGGKTTVTDGPFTEAKELVAGFSILNVKTFAEAVEWAKRAPFAKTVGEGEEVEVELRPLFDASDFDPPAGA